MKFIKTIILSIIILIFCMSTVVSAEINQCENDTTDLNVNTTITDDSLSRTYPNLKIVMNEIFYQGDDIEFEITSTSFFRGTVKISIDDIYHTTACLDQDYLYIKISHLNLAPGNHKIHCEFDGDDQYFYETHTKDFTIREKP